MASILLIDGAQLFHAVRSMKLSGINYQEFRNVLEKKIGEKFDSVLFFQPYNDSIEPHRKLLHFLTKAVDFDVITIGYDLSRQIESYWFSVSLAFHLGMLSEQNKETKFYIVSPDTNLIEPILKTNAELIYFEKMLDEGWQEYINTNQITFTNLDLMIDSIVLKREETVQ